MRRRYDQPIDDRHQRFDPRYGRDDPRFSRDNGHFSRGFRQSPPFERRDSMRRCSESDRHGVHRDDRHGSLQRDERHRSLQRDERHGSPHRDDRRDNRDFKRRLSLSPDGKKSTIMSSVVAVVKKKDDNDDDSYNPMKMLKKSMSSKVEVVKHLIFVPFVYV
jgi:hypothetical protein